MTRQYALIGAGKTGSRIPELLRADENVSIFNSANPPTVEKLSGHDAIICFIPAPVMTDYLEILLDSKIPVISGTTGMEWPATLHDQLVAQNSTWIWAHNFALGMTLAKALIEQMAQAADLFFDASFHIHEVHHTAKLDAPSGTAISWQQWLGKDANISYERQGDVTGDHELTLKTEHEEISIRHKALDRSIFANGALWATRHVLEQNVPSGLISFEELTINRTQGDYYANR